MLQQQVTTTSCNDDRQMNSRGGKEGDVPCRVGLRGSKEVKGEEANAESARQSQQARPEW